MKRHKWTDKWDEKGNFFRECEKCQCKTKFTQVNVWDGVASNCGASSRQIWIVSSGKKQFENPGCN